MPPAVAIWLAKFRSKAKTTNTNTAAAKGMTQAITFTGGSPRVSQDDGPVGLLDRRIDQSNLLGRGGVDIADTRLAGDAHMGLDLEGGSIGSFPTSGPM